MEQIMPPTLVEVTITIKRRLSHNERVMAGGWGPLQSGGRLERFPIAVDSRDDETRRIYLAHFNDQDVSSDNVVNYALETGYALGEHEDLLACVADHPELRALPIAQLGTTLPTVDEDPKDLWSRVPNDRLVTANSGDIYVDGVRRLEPTYWFGEQRMSLNWMDSGWIRSCRFILKK